MKPLSVSVVIPAYNHATWIAQAVQSVCTQSYPVHELIIIDDASTDSTWQCIQELIEYNSTITIRAWRHQTNQGTASTLNEALNAAIGDYLAILNSDDYWHPQRLEQCLQVAQTRQADFIYSKATIDYSHSVTQPKWQSEFLLWYQALGDELLATSNHLTTLLKGNVLLTTSNFVFSRRLWQQLAGFNELRYVHDYDFALKVATADFKMHYLPDALLSYRQHDHNTIHENPALATRENLALLYRWLPHLANQLNTQGWSNLSAQLQSLQTILHGEWCDHLHQALVKKEQIFTAALTEREILINDRDTWIKERDHSIQNLSLYLKQIINSPAYQLGNLLVTPLRWVRDKIRLLRSGYA